ncbi:MAG: TM2 domain-containing protein [Pirellulales bacterium]
MASGMTGGRGKNKITAGILALLLGGFGVHHFYLGSITAGIIVLVLSFLLCGLGGVIALIEGIMLLVMSDADFDAKYNQRTPESLEFVFQKK